MNVEYIQHMGNDMTVVNAARVSFANHSYNSTPSSADISLLKYLARGSSNDEWSALVNKLASTSDRTAIQKLLWAFKTHQTHFAPFTHPQLSVRITAPLAVARQLWKSHVGVAGGDAGYAAWSEESRRYIDATPNMHLPDVWRSRASNVKQGSGDEQVDVGGVFEHYLSCATLYEKLLEDGVAPEHARFVLPAAAETSWIWTGSLMFFVRVCWLRLDTHAQAETTVIANGIFELLDELWPISTQILFAGDYNDIG